MPKDKELLDKSKSKVEQMKNLANKIKLINFDALTS